MPTTSYANAYSPLKPAYTSNIHLHTPPEEYALSFVLPGPINSLEKEGVDVVLEPLIPSLHAEPLFEAMRPHPGLFTYMPHPIFSELGDFLAWLETFGHASPGVLLYTILDNKQPKDDVRRYAGFIAFMSTDATNLKTEIGCVTLFPHAQRTHVLTHTIYLMLDKAFGRGESEKGAAGGWKCRRVEWLCNTLNTPSSKAANRLGFTKEGLARMNRVLPPGQVGTHAGPPGDEDRRSRDTEVWAMCWDEWEEGKKQRLWEMVTRKYGDSKGKIE